MSKKFVLIDPLAPSTSRQQPTTTNWELCFICQEDTLQPLTNPNLSKRKDSGSSYKLLAENLIKFDELSSLPKQLNLNRLNNGEGIEMSLINNKAKWHQSCKLKYNNTMLQRAEKRSRENLQDDDQAIKRKITRSHSEKITLETCFFCGESANTNERFREASTFQLDRRVRASATLVEDTELLARLSAGDMVALEAKYHIKCLVGLYNRARAVRTAQETGTDRENKISGIVFAELVMYIEETHEQSDCATVFKLSHLVQLYVTRLQSFGVNLDSKVHSTRLKNRLLAHFPDLRSYNKGREVLLAFDEDIGAALEKAYEKDNDNDAVILARAAQIVRRDMFQNSDPFDGSFQESCHENSVSSLLLALINMVLEGPNIKDQNAEPASPASLSIAQLMNFNSLKHKRKQGDTPSSVRHSIAQETPVPIYIGLMIHAHTRKKELVDKLFHLGLSVSYDRVLRLSSQMGNSVCESYYHHNVVYPLSLSKNVFTTAAVDNIDHNPSSTSAKDSFHGTGISLIQHPDSSDCTSSSILLPIPAQTPNTKALHQLPTSYTDVTPVNVKVKGLPVSTAIITSLKRTAFREHIKQEDEWLKNARKILDETNQVAPENISWAAYHANQQSTEVTLISRTALLPLFHESAHTVAMIRHSMNVVKTAVNHLNPGQIPVLTFDQPLYAIAKEIQWKWPNIYGEDHFVVMFGGLHIEMAALKSIGKFLEGCGWTEALVQADIASSGTADSFLHAAHITRARRAHQITVVALYILKQKAYDTYVLNTTENGKSCLDFNQWCEERKHKHPQFHYWTIVMEMELCLLTFVRSLRVASFNMYLDALTELAHTFFALDQYNYARWIPVHLKDMAELLVKHPTIAKEFSDGHFVVQKTKHAFSAIAIDQAHEQNNACIKGEGGAIGILDNANALRRWMVAGPEVARVIEEFEKTFKHRGKQLQTRHHEQTESIQTAFAKDVRSLVHVFEDFGNPFEEESMDLLHLESKEIASPSVTKTIQNIQQIGKDQFTLYVEERLIQRTKSLDDVIHRNNLPLFISSTKRTSKEGSKLTSMKREVELFSQLYIACQTRNGNLDEFFRHENQIYPPSLTRDGKLYIGTKSDLLTCFETLSVSQTEKPTTTSMVVDGAATIHMLSPGIAKTFDEYANLVFIPYVKRQFDTIISRLDIVWDIYKSNSLKGTARAKRGKGARLRVVGNAPIPRNWKDFLRVDGNKTELFRFLSKAVIEAFDEINKTLIVTDEDQILSKSPQVLLHLLSPCNHEEADTRILLHVAHAVQCGHRKILIRTVDTDVVVLSVMVMQTFPHDVQLWLAFGNGKMFRYIAAHEIANALGPEKCRALPMFHALTGCDTVSSFVGHGKVTAWSTWNSMPEFTQALLNLTCTPTSIPEETMCAIERFTILLYDRTSTSTNINKTRKKLFTRTSSVQRIPPTLDALKQHVKRAIYQGCYIWGQTLIPSPVLPPVTSWGWSKVNDGLYVPEWITIPEAAKACNELIRCGCKKGCKKGCKCKKSNLPCTDLCICEGECSRVPERVFNN